MRKKQLVQIIIYRKNTKNKSKSGEQFSGPVGKEKYIQYINKYTLEAREKKYYDAEIERNLMQALMADTSLKF